MPAWSAWSAAELPASLRNFGPADTYARFKMMQGFDVFAPIGFDAFGLPAENYAIGIRKLVDEYEAAAGKLDLSEIEKDTLSKLNSWMKDRSHPARTTQVNVQTMIKQLRRMGCMYDWTKLLNTSDPEYYRWTQWVFTQMFKHGLAERKVSLVNWDPELLTAISDLEVEQIALRTDQGHARAQLVIGCAEDADGKQRGIPRVVDRDRRDRNTFRHLRDRQQTVQSLEAVHRDRYADNRKCGQRGHHPRQVGGSSGAGDQPGPHILEVEVSLD